MFTLKLNAKKYHKPILIKRISEIGCSNPRGVFKCYCGNTFETATGSIYRTKGYVKSCGCIKKKFSHRLVHGHKKGHKGSPTYNTWMSMRQRCNNKNNPNFKYYGDRGIKVCSRWENFENFLNDMGERPNNTTIERIDNNKGYSKNNCKWATKKEQARNKRNNRIVILNKKQIKFIELFENSNDKMYEKARHRIDQGWKLEDAISLTS